jgi:TIR domain
VTDWVAVGKEYAATGRHGLVIGARQIVTGLLQEIERQRNQIEGLEHVIAATATKVKVQPPPEVFISYDAPVDRELAAQLAGWLGRRGRTVWWDRELVAGSQFEDVIETRLAQARAVVVIWTLHSCQSAWVRREAHEGLARGVLVPVLWEIDSLPLGFQGLQAVNLTGWGRLLSWSPTFQPLRDLEAAIDGLCQP